MEKSAQWIFFAPKRIFLKKLINSLFEMFVFQLQQHRATVSMPFWNLMLTLSGKSILVTLSYNTCTRCQLKLHLATVASHPRNILPNYQILQFGQLLALMSESTASTSNQQDVSTSFNLSFRLQPDGRQVLTRKRARELLDPLSKAPYTSISLGGCALGDGAAGVAGPALVALANKQCVRSVTLADCIASLPQDEALRSLSALASSIGMWKGLHSVDLSYNALGSRGIAACSALLQSQRQLRELHLIESGLACESARLLQQYLCPGPTTELRVLQIHANRIESQGVVYLAEVVKRSPRLERLRMSSLGAKSSALGTLANALRGKNDMRDLDLSDNYLDAQVAAELSAVLITLPALERLLLRDLAMGDEAAEALLCPLATAYPLPPLTELALAGNELSGVAAAYISETMVTFKNSLQVLELSRNELGSTGADLLVESLSKAKAESDSPALTHLLLAENGIPALSTVRLALQLVAFPSIECFDISGNPVSEDVADRLGTALGSHVVLYDGIGEEDQEDSSRAPETNGGENNTTQTALQSALQELANAPSAAQKADSQQSTTANVDTSSSKSAVSRLRSIFSRGSENIKAKDAPSDPTRTVGTATEVKTVEEPLGLEEDSGTAANDSNLTTPETTFGTPGMRTTQPLPPSTENSDDIPEISPQTPISKASTPGNDEVIKSAKKLKESIASLSKEISDVAGELQIPIASPTVTRRTTESSPTEIQEMTDEVNEYLLVGEPGQASTKQSRLGVFVDVFGGLLVALFVVVLVLAIAQSQEESTFSYRVV